MAKLLLIVSVLLTLIINNIRSHSIIRTKMEELQVVPDVIDRAPEQELTVKYADDKIVKLGNELTPLQVKDAPEVTWNADNNTYYTLAMVDPDAPSREDPKFREVLHWLIGNIHGSDIKNGDHIAEYRGSGPPKGTGLHRYIFLLYKQESKVEFDEPRIPHNSREHRFNFSIKKFAQKYKLGQPVAGNFYQAEWDEFVDIRNKMETKN